MKRTWKCPKCASERIGYLETVLGDGGKHSDGAKKLARLQTGEMLGLKVVESKGGFEAFVCTDCGYTEEYVKSPEQVPWDQLHGFRWCNR